MAITKQKSVRDTLKIKIKESKHITRENYLTMSEDSERGRNQERIYKTTRKQVTIAVVISYLHIITLNVS